jgi:dolichyl-diphosphooligosaccharide--protein glycosyltransferase
MVRNTSVDKKENRNATSGKKISNDQKDKQNTDGIAVSLLAWAVRLPIIIWILVQAYQIRLFAIKNYGLVIHEFDPWFNFRAAQYLADNGWTAFFQWFDYMSWYPLGRPIGTTIYPGMQITSVSIWQFLKSLGPEWEMSLNDVCCYTPAWFGVSATAFVGLLTWEVMNSVEMGMAAAFVMAVVPAHIMRSVGGGYDNESVAMTAMCATFYFWVCSVSGKRSAWLSAICAGLSYFYMAASWGGYIFVLNMIALHALLLAVITKGLKDQSSIYLSYTIFYVIGTACAVQVPVIGWTPLKSLEQLGAFGVFGIYQLLQLTAEIHRAKLFGNASLRTLRIRAVGVCAILGFIVCVILLQQGYFGPLSSRIRGLFVKHTRTGNPLVDSVAEHQATSSDAYWRFLHAGCYLAPLGFFLSFFRRSKQQSFVVLYAVVAYYFSSKMSRLMILMGPITSILVGVTFGGVLHMTLRQIKYSLDTKPEKRTSRTSDDSTSSNASSKQKTPKKTKKKKKKEERRNKRGKIGSGSMLQELGLQAYIDFLDTEQGRNFQLIGGLIALLVLGLVGRVFFAYSHLMAEHMSNPSIIQRVPLSDGSYIVIDDYREAYWWLRDNTPEDARVMSWWDYGYQITGIANRTTIADGNTWNHEHIATLGRTLTAPVRDAHKIARHLADYILIWAGGGGDDLAKSPHMARIGNSVYPDICPGDPTCRSFGFVDHSPTPMMAESLLYNLHSHNQAKDYNGNLIQVNPALFQEVFTSKYKKVRIFKVIGVSEKSKQWVADPANRDCDAPGSWYCRGQYPPALHKLIAKRNDFAQLEDFNTKSANSETARAYQEEYHARMSGRKIGSISEGLRSGGRRYDDIDPEYDDFVEDEEVYLNDLEDSNQNVEVTPPKQPDMLLSTEWKDTQLTSKLFELVHQNRINDLRDLLEAQPSVATVRSNDGRGPLWWAYEFGREDIAAMLVEFGAATDEGDAKGVLPQEVA